MKQFTTTQAITNTLDTLMTPGDVVEVRILKTPKGTVSGYYNDNKKLAADVAKYMGKQDIYFTMNPTKDELLARCNNRLAEYAKQTSSDNDIKRLRHILIDIDPIRASGISSTDVEKSAALHIIKTIIKDLVAEGFPKPVIADSGNGYHLLLPIDLENTAENVAVIKEFLATLDFLYSNEQAQVDVTTYNPSRIVKLYGTTACKGDNTPDRPHRVSKLIKVPKEAEMVSMKQLNEINRKKPKEAVTSKISKATKSKAIDVAAFIAKHGLDLAFQSTFGKNGTKYILNTCPWNSDHTNRSAYILQFENGAVSAGCHHNSCSEENWKSLRELVGDEAISNVSSEKKEEKQSDLIIQLTDDFQFFENELEETFAAVPIGEHWEVLSLKSKKFQKLLTKLYYDKQNSAPGSDGLNEALKVLEMKASFSDQQYKLQKRMAELKGEIFYDLCDKKWRAIKVNKQGCKVEVNPPILFTRNPNMDEQVEPDLSIQSEELLPLVKKHFRFKKESDAILFATYLVTCFIPEIAHVILVLFGEKGAAKSTTMRMVKKIVDPAKQDLLSMPNSKQDLAISISNNYMPCFDNLDSLSAEKSDLLCMASTGGAFTKRTLYSDSDETILQFKRCICLNGINIVATRPDLLDRSILLELERIPKSERKPELQIWRAFEQDIPKFLGAIFNTLSKAMQTYEDVELQEVGRMADFTYWGYAIADAMGIDGEQFLTAYLTNQDTANEEAISSHPVAVAIIALMKTRSNWSSSVSELLKELERVAEKEFINTNIKIWAKDANVLSRRLKEIKSNLEEIGISYEIQNTGRHKKITLTNATQISFRGTKLQRPLEEVDDIEDL
ncbi:hypothetical protein [Lysinibacillus sp.]|uniref:hypothetical protein n=1 Tax=Lysinibacillus sp. TaxID=1869345 RepID=UPI00289E095E|nr:hypothetical protein [Lysinibacillus sp.]